MGQTRSIIIGLALVLARRQSPMPPISAFRRLRRREPCVGCSGPLVSEGLHRRGQSQCRRHLGRGIPVQRLSGLPQGHQELAALSASASAIEFNHWTAASTSPCDIFAAQHLLGQRRLSDIQAATQLHPAPNEYTADIESWVGLANVYVDHRLLACSHALCRRRSSATAKISVLGAKGHQRAATWRRLSPTDNTETDFAWAVL